MKIQIKKHEDKLFFCDKLKALYDLAFQRTAMCKLQISSLVFLPASHLLTEARSVVFYSSAIVSTALYFHNFHTK